MQSPNSLFHQMNKKVILALSSFLILVVCHKGKLMENPYVKGPQLSVIIPSYNCEKYLSSCLDSIAKQTFTDYEVIVVDDGSTDNSLVIANSYAVNDSRFRILIHKHNRGTLLARKTGIDSARGKYILFLDPDDYYKSSTLFNELITHVQKTKVDILHFGFSDFLTNNSRMKTTYRKYLHLSKQTIRGPRNILERCFVDREYSWHLIDKIFNGDIVKRHCHLIPDVYSIMGEDIYLYFLFALYAKSYESRPLHNGYVYRIGTGITSREPQRITTFTRMVRGDSLSRRMIMNLLLAANMYRDYERLFTAFEHSMLELHLDRLSELPSEHLTSGIQLLLQHYNPADVVQSLYRRTKTIKFQIQQLMLPLDQSTTFTSS